MDIVTPKAKGEMAGRSATGAWVTGPRFRRPIVTGLAIAGGLMAVGSIRTGTTGENFEQAGYGVRTVGEAGQGVLRGLGATANVVDPDGSLRQDVLYPGGQQAPTLGSLTPETTQPSPATTVAPSGSPETAPSATPTTAAGEVSGGASGVTIETAVGRFACTVTQERQTFDIPGGGAMALERRQNPDIASAFGDPAIGPIAQRAQELIPEVGDGLSLGEATRALDCDPVQ